VNQKKHKRHHPPDIRQRQREADKKLLHGLASTIISARQFHHPAPRDGCTLPTCNFLQIEKESKRLPIAQELLAIAPR